MCSKKNYGTRYHTCGFVTVWKLIENWKDCSTRETRVSINTSRLSFGVLAFVLLKFSAFPSDKIFASLYTSTSVTRKKEQRWPYAVFHKQFCAFHFALNHLIQNITCFSRKPLVGSSCNVEIFSQLAKLTFLQIAGFSDFLSRNFYWSFK